MVWGHIVGVGQSRNGIPQSLLPLWTPYGYFNPNPATQGQAEEAQASLGLPGCLQVEHGVVTLVGTGGCHSGDQ